MFTNRRCDPWRTSFLIAILVVACGETSTTDPTDPPTVTECPEARMVTANVDGDTTWENWIPDPTCFDYIVSASQLINDETLTIEPGTAVGFQAELGLRVRGDAALIAAGTATDPILITGVTAVRGFWKGVSLEFTGDTPHVITHTTIEYAGGADISNTENANLIVEGGVEVRLENSTFRQSTGYGLFLARDSDVTGSGGNVMTENALGAAYAFGSEVSHLTHGGGSVTGNDVDVVVVFPTRIDDDAVWATGVYRILRVGPEEFQVYGSLALGPGVELRFEADQSMRVQDGAGLAAVGTSDQPVVITGTEAVPGHWRGLVFADTDNPMNRLEHVVVEYGGGDHIGGTFDLATLALTWGNVPSRVTVSNTVVRGSAGYGVYARFGSRLEGFENNTLTENQLGPASIDANVVAGLMPSSTFAGNGVDEITVNAASNTILDADATWHDLGVPFFVKRINSEEPRVTSGATLTLEPGVELLVGPGVGLAFWDESSLFAVGTAEAPIVIRGKEGPWKGLDFFDATGTLDYIEIMDAGSSPYGLIEAAGVVSVRTNGESPPESRVELGGQCVAVRARVRYRLRV